MLFSKLVKLHVSHPIGGAIGFTYVIIVLWREAVARIVVLKANFVLPVNDIIREPLMSRLVQGEFTIGTECSSVSCDERTGFELSTI